MDEDDGPDTVGRRIAKIASARGLRPKDLEKVSGLDRGSIGKLLRGDRESTSFEAGLKIARFLGVDPYELMPGDRPRLTVEHAVAQAGSPWPTLAEIQAQIDELRGLIEQRIPDQSPRSSAKRMRKGRGNA